MKVRIQVIRKSDNEIVYGNYGDEKHKSIFENDIKNLKFNTSEYIKNIETIDDSNDIIRAKRKAEYRSIEEVLHIILDFGMNSQEYTDLQAERAAIKAKYPKE